ncbi:hypothetical protein GON03_09380 [Nocardioides sp. MAH-18]|uniref:Uncharacterized protein n=1 Tax=Nocardioides agri TaxID=2682843 RepID=A0A6L6XRI9_9ACTN|nr:MULTISPECIES: hypothetical protein [unclassified Nocardioides]MBA2954533.1 hypothetical protein [Nocardioides sp. CGMCC 1.13656]MVQ49392.1 hypothetical protein [Nocardioides sp. MAH-18]
MTVLLISILVIVSWSVLSIPLAIAVGRALRAGQVSQTDARFAEIVRDYDAAGV